MKTTLQSFVEKSEGFPLLSSAAMEGFTQDFWDGVELNRSEMKAYYLAKEFLCWYAENCAALEGDYHTAQRFYKKRDKANKMRHNLRYNVGMKSYKID